MRKRLVRNGSSLLLPALLAAAMGCGKGSGVGQGPAELRPFVGIWPAIPRFAGDNPGQIIYKFQLVNGQGRFTMGGRVFESGLNLVFGRYFLEAGQLNVTLEYECMQLPSAGWYLCEDPYIRALPSPERHAGSYSIEEMPNLNFRVLKYKTERSVQEQGWYAAPLNYEHDGSAVGKLAGLWQCHGCSFGQLVQMNLYKASSGYRFHWVQDVSAAGGYQGLAYWTGRATADGTTLTLTSDALYQCPSTVTQSNVSADFLVSPGHLLFCQQSAATDALQLSYTAGTSGNFRTLQLTGGTLAGPLSLSSLSP